MGDGSDAEWCGHERGSGYPYPGCENNRWCDGGRTGPAVNGGRPGQGGKHTCECAGKVRIG